MTSRVGGSSPSGSSGVDDARALYDTLTDDLLERVRDLIDSGDGGPFAPAGKVFREWISIPAIDRDLWPAVLAEAVDFARESLGDRS